MMLVRKYAEQNSDMVSGCDGENEEWCALRKHERLSATGRNKGVARRIGNGESIISCCGARLRLGERVERSHALGTAWNGRRQAPVRAVLAHE